MPATPNRSVFIDFDGIDPDIPRELVPSNLGRVTWEKLLSITLDDLSQRIAPEVLFVSGGSSSQVQHTGVSISEALNRILPVSKFYSLADRDDKSTAEVHELEGKGMIILPQRNLESFLFADDIIEALVVREQKQAQLGVALQIKQTALANSITRGNPADDLKSAAGEIYVELKRLLGLQRCGTNTDAFMRDTLAPLVLPTMATYQALKAAVIDKTQ